MRRIVAATIAVLVVLVVAIVTWRLTIASTPAPGLAEYGRASGATAVPAASASPADDGNWTMPGKDYASTRFSALNQITPANVGKLSVALTFSTGTTEGFEAPPLV